MGYLSGKGLYEVSVVAELKAVKTDKPVRGGDDLCHCRHLEKTKDQKATNKQKGVLYLESSWKQLTMYTQSILSESDFKKAVAPLIPSLSSLPDGRRDKSVSWTRGVECLCRCGPRQKRPQESRCLSHQRFPSQAANMH